MGQCFVYDNEENEGFTTPGRVERTPLPDSSPLAKSISKVGDPTRDELKLVLEHFDAAQKRNMEAILTENEPQVLEHRDKIYTKAQADGITAESHSDSRLSVLSQVVEYLFMNVEPPNHYTKITDRKHFIEVAEGACTFAKERNIAPSVVLVVSSWYHDVERFIPSTKCQYLPEAVDQHRKQAIHPLTSANVAMCLLKGAPITEAERARIYQMILHHDMPTPREDLVILGTTLIEGADDDLMWELELMMDSDSFAFFQSTISLFIEFKAKKNSPEWLWERVRNNVKRLRPHLRAKAAVLIKELPAETLSKMAVDWEELSELCADGGAAETENDPLLISQPKSPVITSNDVQSAEDFEEIEDIGKMSDLEVVSEASSAPSVDGR